MVKLTFMTTFSAKLDTDIYTEPTVETGNEAKKVEEILRVSVESNHQNDENFLKNSLWKALRFKCRARTFIVNCRKSSNERIRGLLTTAEMTLRRSFI